jgi:hypothetical protein
VGHYIILQLLLFYRGVGGCLEIFDWLDPVISVGRNEIYKLYNRYYES